MKKLYSGTSYPMNLDMNVEHRLWNVLAEATDHFHVWPKLPWTVQFKYNEGDFE